MNQDDLSADKPDDDRLAHLLREAAHRQERDVPEPSAEAVEACLLGHATAEQREEIKAALESSSSFRRVYLELSRELETVDQHDQAPLNSAMSEALPSLDQFLKSGANRPLRMALRSRVLALAAGLVVVAAAAAWWAMRGPEKTSRTVNLAAWSLSVRDVDPGILLRDAPRGAPGVESPAQIHTSQEAALAAFSQVLRFDGTNLVADTSNLSQSPAAMAGSASNLVLMLAAGDGPARSIRLSHAELKARDTGVVELWALVLPSRNLYRIAAVGDTIRSTWPSPIDSIVVIAACAGSANEFQAGEPKLLVR